MIGEGNQTTWRLMVDDQPRSGAANMALDQAIAEACAAGTSLPTLRFYRWEPAAVSLGRHQPAAEIDLAAAEGKGYDVVRRPTGGRAILHTDELTYSVAAAASEPLMHGGIMDAYLRLSDGLLAGLHELGLRADRAAGHIRAGPEVSPACFETPSAYEITAQGRKLIGSAQSRRAGYVLQHGSLPLCGDIARVADVLALAEGERATLRAELAARAGTLAQALGVTDDAPEVAFERVADVLSCGFGHALHLTLKPGQPTGAELRRTAELIRTIYANSEWTNQR